MAKERILGKCIGGGPLDNQYFSTPADNEVIEGFNDMTDKERYVKDESTLRPFEREETGLVKLLFDTDAHKLTQICFFNYENLS